MSVNHAKTDASNRKKQNNASTDLTKLMLIMMNGSSSEKQPVHPIHYQNIPNLNLMARQHTPVIEERTNGTEYATSFHEYKKKNAVHRTAHVELNYSDGQRSVGTCQHIGFLP
ncbi:hypothetical protein [uncultured Ruminobacter sp.]|uniref:hypothetical protein n=1 Tax=Ruminobacter sp. TaxID=2774296 RepID=UPI0025DD7E12|nr:hypothetical protein [uncultured Ruminobacter sp.]